MSEAFEQAATRHYRDANLLKQEERRSNADHLFGFAAECAVKTALRQLPGFAPNGELASYYRAHINDLWDRIGLMPLQKRFPVLMALLKQNNPFRDWSVDNRYEREEVTTEEALNRHCEMAKRLLGSVGNIGTRMGS